MLSLRSLAEKARVSKTAPYRHFKDKDVFLGALADEGFRRLHSQLEQVGSIPGNSAMPAMGKAYMDFALAHPALYRLMHSSLVCTLPAEQTQWARRSLLLLAHSLEPAGKPGESAININATVAAWAYIHGLVSIRIDGLFPADLSDPDWNRLASIIPSLPASESLK